MQTLEFTRTLSEIAEALKMPELAALLRRRVFRLRFLEAELRHDLD